MMTIHHNMLKSKPSPITIYSYEIPLQNNRLKESRHGGVPSPTRSAADRAIGTTPVPVPG